MLLEDDQPNDLKGDSCTNLFFEECNHSITNYVSEQNLIAIQGQKNENKVDSKHVKSDGLPLCFSSFEWLKERLKVSDQNRNLRLWMKV